MPGCANESQDEREGQSTMRIPNLVIDDLIKRTAFIEKSVELDNVRVLDHKSNRFVRHNKMTLRLTEAPYWFEVPSKQSTIARGWRTVESVDMVVAARESGSVGQTYG